ncbi:Transcription initiation factor TFIID subunit 6-like protein [Drosera capensis]
MSIVPKESIEVIAQSIGISNLSAEAALALAPDVEYRMREIMQEAIKCMRHSRRTTLTTDDVDAALNLRNVEPIYGFASGDPLRFKRAVGHTDLFYIDDKEIDFKDVIEAPLPKAPLDTSIMCHWLAIEGIQPAIPENAPIEVIGIPDVKRPENGDIGLPVDIRLPVRHVLSMELQLYFDKITELAIFNSDSVLFKEALVSFGTDPGLHPLVPYFTCFIADEVSRGLGNLCVLFALMRLVRSLLKNPHIHIEPYLHQLMPSVVTCLVAKKLGNRFADNHWELRDYTAKLPRLTKTLINAFLDPKRAITQHYGAIQGLAALGSNVVRLLILPNIEPYLRLLEPEMLLENQKNEMKRHEAWTVYGALLHAAGQCIYDQLKSFPALPSHLPRTFWRKNATVITHVPDQGKRKATMEDLEQQPPFKKVAMDGPTDATFSDTTVSKMQIGNGSPIFGGNNVSLDGSSSSKDVIDHSSNGRHSLQKSDIRAPKLSAIVRQIWKNELKSGKILVSLHDLFGESILPFIPTPELSLFIRQNIYVDEDVKSMLSYIRRHYDAHAEFKSSIVLGFPMLFGVVSYFSVYSDPEGLGHLKLSTGCYT